MSLKTIIRGFFHLRKLYKYFLELLLGGSRRGVTLYGWKLWGLSIGFPIDATKRGVLRWKVFRCRRTGCPLRDWANYRWECDSVRSRMVRTWNECY